MEPLINLSKKQLNSIFPFHFILGRDLCIQSSGPSLTKLIGIKSKQKFYDVFELQRPTKGNPTFEELLSHLEVSFIFFHKDYKNTRFKGQFIFLKEKDALLFIGQPWVGSLEKLNELNLTLSDFPLYDSTIDQLYLVKNQELANEDILHLIETINKQKKNLEKLAFVASSNRNGVVFTDTKGNIDYINERFKNLTGYELGEIKDKNPINLGVGPESSTKEIDKAFHAFNSKEPFKSETRYYRKDTTWFWSRIHGQPVFSKSGVFLHYFTTIEDITAEKEAKDRLFKFEETFRLVLESFGDNIWEHDFRLDKTVFSNTQHNFLGLEINENQDIAKAWYHSILEEDLHIVKEADQKYRSGKLDSHQMEYRLHHSNGSIKWVLDRGIVTEKDKNGLPLKIIGIHLDITPQKNSELELIKQREKAEKSERAKDQFFANMSHEIRTPMNAIIGMNRQLEKTKLLPEQQKSVSVIKASADHLLGILEHILDLSKLESGKFTLDNQGFLFEEMVQRVMEIMTSRAQEKNINFEIIRFDRKISQIFVADPVRISQVLINILSNAIKFTEKGYVNIEFQLESDLPDKQIIKVIVKDTGIGMSNDFLDKNFEKYSQENSPEKGGIGGTGIGISICKELLSLMKGKIEIESEKGTGTTVSITLPLKKGSENDLPKDEVIVPNKDYKIKPSILVVDDNEFNKVVALAILEENNFQTDSASNGKEAVEKVKNNWYDLIFMDIKMPVMDGIEATKIIKEELKINIPIIALTAFALKGDEEYYKSRGFDGYLPKPFKENDMFEITHHHLSNNPHFENTIENTSKLYSIDEFEYVTKGNTKLIEKLLNLFLIEAKNFIAEIYLLLEKEDFERAKFLAHSIKPSLIMLEAEGLVDEIKEFENGIISEGKSNRMVFLANKLVTNLKKLISEIEKNELINVKN